MVPKFIIQPLVENSLRHGMISSDIPIKILLSATTEAYFTKIILCDDGKGCDPDLLNDYLAYKTDELQVTNGFGIRNVNDRIHLKYKDDSNLSYFTDENGHLCAKIELRFFNNLEINKTKEHKNEKRNSK